MGANSSQPVADPLENTTTVSTHTYSPRMDYIAASQQLIDEETMRASHATGESRGTSETPAATPSQRKRKRTCPADPTPLGRPEKRRDDIVYSPSQQVEKQLQPKRGLIKALVASSDLPTATKPWKKRGPRPGEKRGPYKTCKTPPNPSKTSRRSQPDDSVTAADRALNTVHELHRPHDLPNSGAFIADEDELIRRAIRDYQDKHALKTQELVAIIQWTSDLYASQVTRTKADWTAQELEDEQEAFRFWKRVMQTDLKRPLERVKAHVRSQYHTFKTGKWTEAEDEQLKSLMERHPSEWKLISLAMGTRSQHQVHNRWRDCLRYGEHRNISRWSQEEEQRLLNAITTVAQKDEDHRAEAGKPSRAVYHNADIDWAQVCVEMGETRSRLQCTVKWSQMKTRDPPATIQLRYRAGRTPDPNAIVETPPQKRTSNVGITPKKRGRPRKSEGAGSLESSDHTIEPKSKKRNRSRKSEESVAAKHDKDATRTTKEHRKSEKLALTMAEDGQKQTKDEGENVVEQKIAHPKVETSAVVSS